MNRINKILTLSSFSVLLVTAERFSFTEKIVLQPYSFFRLHEVIQMLAIILLTVLIPFFLLKELTGNFKLLRTDKGFWLTLLFIIGLYFYATGNGVHETAGYIFNNFCNTKHITGLLCGGTFFNDFYFGNILYFAGGLLMNLVLLVFEQLDPESEFNRKEYAILGINAVIYSLAIFAYAAFDRVLVGLGYSLVMTAVIYGMVLIRRTKMSNLPVTVYFAVTYTLGTLASLIVRFHLY